MRLTWHTSLLWWQLQWGALYGCVLDNSPLCATLPTLYKLRVPWHIDEFTGQLRTLVASTFEIRDDVDSAESRLHQERSRELVAMYGWQVLPEELLRLRNKDLTQMEHVAVPGTDPAVVKRRMFDCLLRLVWLVEEKPAVTRFVAHSLLLRILPHEVVGCSDKPLHIGSPGNRAGLV